MKSTNAFPCYTKNMNESNYIQNSSKNVTAMKMIEKDFIIKNDKFKIVLQEKNILSMIDHPFINKLYETY